MLCTHGNATDEVVKITFCIVEIWCVGFRPLLVANFLAVCLFASLASVGRGTRKNRVEYSSLPEGGVARPKRHPLRGITDAFLSEVENVGRDESMYSTEVACT
jgi:hypothetical protein